MGLKSRIFKGDPVFEACLVRDNAHIKYGAVGKHVAKIHTALFRLDNLDVTRSERDRQAYEDSTVRAVLAYKRKRKIINRSYENDVDPIVGKMTIASLDEDMFRWENNPEDVRKRPEIQKAYTVIGRVRASHLHHASVREQSLCFQNPDPRTRALLRGQGRNRRHDRTPGQPAAASSWQAPERGTPRLRRNDRGRSLPQCPELPSVLFPGIGWEAPRDTLNHCPYPAPRGKGD